MRHKLFLLLVLSWLIGIGESEIVSVMLNDTYSKLDPNAPNEEKKKFYPVSTVDGSSLCPEGQFKDYSVGGRPGQNYCFLIPQLSLDSRGRQRIPATDDESRLLGCEYSSFCSDFVKNTFSVCDKTTGYKYKLRDEDKDVDGICIKSEGVAYVYTEIYNNLPHNTPIEEKKKYLPVSYGSQEMKKCHEHEQCDKGQFCGGADNFPNARDYQLRMCYYFPKLVDSNNEGPIIVLQKMRPDGLSICRENSHCSCYGSDSDCENVYSKCFLKSGLKFVVGYGKKEIDDGICIRANPISLIFSDIYLKLNDDVTYEERRKFFPVDYKGLADSTVPKNCSMNKECADGQFCGMAYDYQIDVHKYRQVLVRYCFTIPHSPDSHNFPRVIPIVPDTHDMELCNNSVRCKADEHWRCDMETGMNFVKKEPELEKEMYNGICVKEHPVANVYSEHYKTISNDVDFEERKKYFPVDYGGFSQNTLLKTCSINSDCGDGQFCGAVYDSTDDAPKQNMFYCFAVIQFPEVNNGPRIVGKPASHNLAPCNQNSDCGSDELWMCDLETGMKFAGEVGGKRELFNGICIKAPPVALVFSDTYLKLNSDVSYEEKRKFFAVDYVEPNQNSALKTCTTNKDCDDGQFCDQILDFATNLAEPGRIHCFAIPIIPAPFHESTKITIQPDKSGLLLCNEPTDCESELFCNIETGQKYVKSKEGVNENVEYNGICMKAEICQVNEHNEQFKWSFGTSPTNSKISCESDEDCDGTRDTADSIFQSYCVLNKAYNNVNLCCHRETRPCKMGKLVGAGVRCGKNEGFKDGIFAECNGGLEKMGRQGEKADKWCDMGNNQCCQDQTNDKIQYCPDGQTPLFNEPKCRDYDENVADSGKCIDKIGSICKNGHCCPDVKTDAQGKLVRNKHSYTTNHPCVPGIRPPQFPAGYCEPGSRKVVIFGELSPLNETMTRWPEESPKTCQKDSDCSSDNSKLCIYNDKGYCYYNPMRHVPIQSSNVVIIIMIVIGIIILIAAIAGVTVWMLMRKKKNLVKPAAILKSPSAQTLSKSIESKVSAESVSGMKTPTVNSII